MATIRKRLPNLYLENANLPYSFRNFSGRAGKYNREGDRNFCVFLDEDKLEFPIQHLIDDNWNVHVRNPRDENDVPSYFIPVTVSFRDIPGLPNTKVYLYSGRNRTELTEETISTLDNANFLNVDLTIRPRVWEDDNGVTRVKAYLQEMHVTIEENRWAQKYASYEYPQE